MKYHLFVLSFILTSKCLAQICDCQTNYNWVKTTFEQNDAGFEHALENKGRAAYEAHNALIKEKINTAKTLPECTILLYEWLSFFRKGHIAIELLKPPTSNQETDFKNWERRFIKTTSFKKYLVGLEAPKFEGIWKTGSYTIGIQKEATEYIGFIIESETPMWTIGQVKLRFSLDTQSSTFYLRDHSPVHSNSIELMGQNRLIIGNTTLNRVYPEIAEEPQFEQYFKTIDAELPYLDQLDSNTLYFRIPSFQSNQKKYIDSVIFVNKSIIGSTKNLIIDIRNGTGGSDASFNELIPFLYTNPIRSAGVQYLSTPLNNKRMLDFINKPEFEFSEKEKEWAKKSFDTLQNHIGQWVNLENSSFNTLELDSTYAFPEQVAIIINEQNASTDEEFLLAAKQSKKVSLFGTTTFGVLDISNMYFVTSPCEEFNLGYCLTKSYRVPEFTIDSTGIQPDFYLDNAIPKHQWVDYVMKRLNGL